MYNVLDNALKTYPLLKEYATSCHYGDVENPYDGVTYPLINWTLPGEVAEEVSARLGAVPNSLFLRMSPKGVHCPHPVHHDLSMGKFSMMLYLFEHGGFAGTGFVAHKKTGVMFAPENENIARLVGRDCAEPDSWLIISHAQAKENRMITFPAGLFHCALPIGGFGTDPTNARIVLTAFYD